METPIPNNKECPQCNAALSTVVYECHNEICLQSPSGEQVFAQLDITKALHCPACNTFNIIDASLSVTECD